MDSKTNNVTYGDYTISVYNAARRFCPAVYIATVHGLHSQVLGQTPETGTKSEAISMAKAMIDTEEFDTENW